MTEPQLTYYPLGEGVTAFSTTRHGGFSRGNYGAFNVNRYCGDAPEAIRQNRRLLSLKLGVTDDRIVMPHQVHGVQIRKITLGFLYASADEQTARLEGVDAVMTNVHGVCIGVSTADCIPIIIYDPQHEAVCTVHAGPGISMEAFEVGDEVYDAFAAANFPMEAISRRMPAMDGTPIEKWHIDLWACNRLQLQAVGVLPEHIHVSGICTWQQSDDYFSARRLGIQSGRILTAAILR